MKYVTNIFKALDEALTALHVWRIERDVEKVKEVYFPLGF